MDRVITSRPKERGCSAGADEQLPQLLDSPLPTPRRSYASVDAARLRYRRDPSPLRTRVPFSWESSPGVPKKSACSSRDVYNTKAQEGTPPPRPPPGRPPPCPARNWHYGNTSEASSDDDDDDRSFSDALDRISSPERIGSFDRVTSKRFEDIFVGRATSFAKDPAGRAASSMRNDPVVPMQLMQRIRMDATAEEMSPRACGLMVFFPWSPKPAVRGFRSPSQSQQATPRAGAGAPAPCSHGRRDTTLRDAMKAEENEAGSGWPQQRGEKRSRDRQDLQSRRWGVSSLLDTSKKYCTDARKALSKLSIGRGTDGGSPRVSSEGSGKLQSRLSAMPTVASKPKQLKASRY